MSRVGSIFLDIQSSFGSHFGRGIVGSNLCQLCNCQPEIQVQLFFNCPFSSVVWTMVLEKLNCTTTTFYWERLQEWLLSDNWCSKFQKNLVFFALSTTVYYIWQECNQRFHFSLQRNSQIISGEILQNNRLTTSSWRKI